MTSINIMFGRAAGLSYGYAVSLDQSMVLLVNMLIESILVLLVYPIFVFSWNHLLEIKLLKKSMLRIGETAKAKRDWVQKYGLIGLMLFVFVPFWMTGPVIGCVVGYLLDFNPWRNIAVVLSATYVAIFIWAIFLRSVNERVAEYSPIGPVILVLSVILVAAGGRYLQRKRNNAKSIEE